MLYLKELKKICFSMVYMLFLVLLFFGWYKNFYGVTAKEIAASEGNGTSVVSEITGGSVLRKPKKEDGSFGGKSKEIPDKIMLGGTDMLIIEYRKNSYATYPFNYYKEVVLNKKEQKQILNILCEITGLTEEQLQNLPDDYFPAVNGNIMHPGGYQKDESGNFVVKAGTDEKLEGDDKTKHFIPQVSYNRFKELMKEAETVIGEGSNYSMDMLRTYYGQVEMNYEEALEEYNKTIYEDKVSSAFARLFCDYLTRSLGLYPVFLAVVFCMRDRKSRMNELIDCKQVSTRKLIVIRYMAMLTAIMLPVILLSFESLVPLIQFSLETGISIDIFAFLKYILWWLLPTGMIVTALGMSLTVYTSTPVAIIVQSVWWFIDSGVTALSGDTGFFTLMIRHNTLNGLEVIQEDLKVICINRGLMTVLALILVALTCRIYERKRKGKMDCAYYYREYFDIFKERLYARFQK